MTTSSYRSWGRYPKVEQSVRKFNWRDEALPLGDLGDNSFLPFGNGRSYGDVCLNAGGVVIDCRGLDRFIHFDAETGVLRCEGGVLFSDILKLTVPKGWFLPVTPGTQFVTLGGAIANDVHGKNHHRAGTFGCHVRSLELLRSDGTRLVCSPGENADCFRATVGGLGLTGVITWAEIQLKAISGSYIDQEVIRYDTLDEFFDLSRESDEAFEYTVAWIDSLAKGRNLGRGLFSRGNHAARQEKELSKMAIPHLTFPIDVPISLINGLSIRLFNALYYHKQSAGSKRSLVPYSPFFYPLDSIFGWNKVYGSKGFLQYQCVLPRNDGAAGLREILGRIAAAGAGSFLTVLKMFGGKTSPGLLSFPRPGVTLTLDFPNRGEKTLRLLDSLDEVTRRAGGAVNPSKDARMSAENFQNYYPAWREMTPFIDPQASSSFWRRVTAQAQ